METFGAIRNAMDLDHGLTIIQVTFFVPLERPFGELHPFSGGAVAVIGFAPVEKATQFRQCLLVVEAARCRVPLEYFHDLVHQFLCPAHGRNSARSGHPKRGRMKSIPPGVWNVPLQGGKKCYSEKGCQQFFDKLRSKREAASRPVVLGDPSELGKIVRPPFYGNLPGGW